MSPIENPKKVSSSTERPWFLTGFMIGLLLISVFQILKFVQVLMHFGILKELGLTVPPILLGLEGLVWSAAGLFMGWAIWTRKPWSPVVGTLLCCLYTIYFWIGRIWIAEPAGLAQRWPINLFVTILGLGGALLILNHKTSQRYFRKSC